MVRVDLPDGRVIAYVIDGANRRVGKKVNGVLVKGWLYKDSLKPIAELDGAGNVVAEFVYGSKHAIGQMIALAPRLANPVSAADLTKALSKVCESLTGGNFSELARKINIKPYTINQWSRGRYLITYRIFRTFRRR